MGDFIAQILAQGSSPLNAVWLIFLYGGWLIILIAIAYGIYQIWLFNKQGAYAASVSYLTLAIDVPKQNEQSPKAVEQIFAHLSGAHKPPDWYEKYFLGMFQLAYSFELISINGKIQFIVRTPADYHDLVEAAVYAQYPDAVISEVNDYAKDNFFKVPNPEMDLWGTEFAIYNKDYFPIRTYPEFEHILSGELKDPLTPMLETLGGLKNGEQVWMQLILTPTGNDWQKKGLEAMNKLSGIKVAPKKSKLAKNFGLIGGEINSLYNETVKQALSGFGESSAPASKSKSDEAGMKLLAPHERSAVEAIQRKISKIGYSVKWRVIYLGKKEIFSAARVITPLVGAIKQFNSSEFNGFAPQNAKYGIKVGHHPWAKKIKVKKQNKIMRAYRDRDREIGHPGFILNTEELATIWHFPAILVKAPQVSKSEAKHAEPPSSLPLGR
ncbi:MAG: hypothetical protein WCW02_00495 [Candidatus Buchananbacteria bacterium]